MKHRLLTMCAMALLMAGVACAQGAMVKRGNSKGDGMSFLTRAGVDLSQVARLPDVLDLSRDDIPYYRMDVKMGKLLENVRHFSYYFEVTDNGIEGSYSIVGVHDYGDGRTLVLYAVEYGDGGNLELASYNVRGQLVDFVDLGYGRDCVGYNIDDNPASDVRVYITRSLELPNDSVVVVREAQRVVPGNMGDWTDKDVLGRADKTVRYAINSLGQLSLQGIESTHSGTYIEQSHRFEDIRDLHYHPVSRYERIDLLNEMVVRPDVVKDMTSNEYSDAHYELHHAAADMIMTNTVQVFFWLARHRDNNLEKIFAQCAASGLIDMGMIRNELKKLPSVAMRNRMGRMLDKWQPTDAE